MLFPLMMALLFVAPLCGYYRLWSRHNTPLQTIPDIGTAVFALLAVYGVLFVGSAIVLPMYYGLWIMFLLWGIVGPIFLAIYLRFAKQAPPQKRKATSRTSVTQIFMICLLLASNLVPMIGYVVNTSYCFYSSQDEAASLVLALAAYHDENNQFPTTFVQLVDEYLESMP